MLTKLIHHLASRWRFPDAAALDTVPAMVASGRTSEAEVLLRARLAGHPDDANALNFLGLICHQRGDHAEAVRLIARAVDKAPDAGFFHANLGEALRAAGLLQQAERHARVAVLRVPDSPEFAYNLANILFQRHAYAEALIWVAQALLARPDWVEAMHLAAKLEFELGHLAKASLRYGGGLALRPGDPEMVLALARTRLWACDWQQDLAGLSQVLRRWAAQPMAPEFGGLNPFVAYQFDLPPVVCKAVADAHALRFLAAHRQSPPHFDFSSRIGRSGTSRRLRVGYVSADFHGHPTMHLMRGLFGLHDRTRFEVTAYSIGADDGGAYRRAVVADVERFSDIRNESATDSAHRIFADGIDILVDLKGFTVEARPEIFALRPAPLSVAWLGYPGSTGTGLNDYAIVDHVIAPPGHDDRFGEQLVRMPHSYQINDNHQAIADRVPSRSELGLPDGAFVFACFNHLYKLDATMFDCWMRILHRVPGSILWLYQSNAEARANLETAAERRGIEAGRLVFAGTMDKPAHLARLARADLFLDTLLVNAHTGASDALWAGLPLISCPQQGFPSRVGASLLCAAGLPQLVCASMAEYEALAVRLAGAPDELLATRRQLSSAHEQLPLFDTPRFVRNLESAYETMWQRFLAGQPPMAFDVKEQP